MRLLEIKVGIVGGVTIDQLAELDKTLHTRINEYLLSLPIKCDKNAKVIEHTHA